MFNYNQPLYDEDGNIINIANINISTIFREHCDFKDAPCNYYGRGWYDRCAWCKDNNGFKRKTDDNSKPF